VPDIRRPVAGSDRRWKRSLIRATVIGTQVGLGLSGTGDTESEMIFADLVVSLPQWESIVVPGKSRPIG